MVDFKKLKTDRKTLTVVSPKELFNQLPKPPGIDDLHESQALILDQWFDGRNDCKDYIVKLHTGGGKTLAGLLMAFSSMKELKKGALYLVENKQLVDQVVALAVSLHIPAIAYSRNAVSEPDFQNGDAVLVASYQALFNGLSKFGTRSSIQFSEVSIVIIDDAHSALSAIRDVFSLTIDSSEEKELYVRICNFFKDDFEKADRLTTITDFINGIGGTSSEVLEVPFWAWLDKKSLVSELISDRLAPAANGDTESVTIGSFKFSWPLIKDNLKFCRAIISQRRVTITPFLPIVDLFPTFENAPRRVFMSATFADDGSITRSFGIGKTGDPRTLSAKTLAGVGRRMIIPLDRKYFSKDQAATLMEDFAKNKKGAIVLVSSMNDAHQWKDRGFWVVRREEAANAVHRLQDKMVDRPVVFVNRFNGIDLPNDSCRILLLDGLPSGVSDYDKLSALTFASSSFYAKSIAQTIEQAFGRGTRGSGDYCLVLLGTEDLKNWVYTNTNTALFSLPTQAQIKCGKEVFTEIADADDYLQTITKGALNDPDFSAYVTEYTADYIDTHQEASDEEGKAFAKAERKAFDYWWSGNAAKAIRTLNRFSDDESHEEALRSHILRLSAQIFYSEGDCSDSVVAYRHAHALNKNIIKPVELVGHHASAQAEKVVETINNIQLRGGKDPISVLERRILPLLNECSHVEFEAALCKLGEYIGLESGQYDKNGQGPDVMWMYPDDEFGIILEAKNEKGSENPFTKSEQAQLLTAENWFKVKYPGKEFFSASVHPSNLAHSNANASQTLVLTSESLHRLCEAVKELWIQIVNHSISRDIQTQECDRLLDKLCLRHEIIAETYFEFFIELK